MNSTLEQIQSMKSAIRVFVCTVVALAFATLAHSQGAQSGLPLVSLAIGNAYRVEAEVAHTPEQRAIGLMFRDKMADNHGMLFVYREKDKHAMWMKNTLIPLSVAFIDEKGVIINIEEMKAQTLDVHEAKKPAAYSLEMNAGWFAKRKIGPGAKILGLEKAPAPQ